ncbi:ABC transporter substrate-binding protein [Desulfonatronum sp. SC1]|uniref:ABC transporter substrate-binding protein n=1 Tax=Desulfonatronum sp. SC1 TaxID=2109626 RepID=UPI000D307F7C|nr:ABC transporter substrate-binding protein [Desulfonatronum sp. SC1]PTN33027.1 ABC transporter substrate-binding protein [Desulfonatronum sp. SC1]
MIVFSSPTIQPRALNRRVFVGQGSSLLHRPLVQLFPVLSSVPFRALAALLCCLLCAIVPEAARAEETASRLVRFIPHWSPQAQFAGYYVAKDKGFYARRGLEVELLRGGPDNPAGPALAQGRAEFASMFLSGGLELRSRGVPAVNIGQIVQRSALMLVAKKSSGILSPIDLDGKRVSVWPDFQAQPLAFFRRYHMNVTVIPQGYTLDLFLLGGVDAASAMWYNEYNTLIHAGINENELSVFFLADYGANFPEDGLYCLESLVRADPDLVRDFVRASLEGWLYAFDHPEEALDAVMRRVEEANLPTNRVHQRWMLARMRDIILPEGGNIPLGRLEEQDYELVATELFETGVITHIAPFRSFYDPRFSAE